MSVPGKKYMEEWNFENWGVKYWSMTPKFLQFDLMAKLVDMLMEADRYADVKKRLKIQSIAIN